MKIIRVVLAVGLMVSAFGATGDVRRQETERIQREIDRVSEGGGGRVVIEKGIHPCGTLYLKNGVDLHLEEGAVLSGGSRSEDYEDAIPLREIYSYVDSQTDTMTRKAFVYAENATNIAITGTGVIDGHGADFFDKSTVLWERFWAKPPCMRPRMVVLLNCRGIRLEGATFKDSPMWTMWIRHCEDIVVSKIRIEAEQQMINSDGIDLDSCRNVRVDDSSFKTGDDCLVLRAIRRPNDKERDVVCENIIVSNCVLDSACQGVRIGCPSDDTIRNAVFRDIVFKGNNAISSEQPVHYLERGDRGRLRLSNILFEGWRIDCFGRPVDLWAEKDVELVDFGHIVIRDVDVRARSPFRIVGNTKTPVRDVVLQNIRGIVTGEVVLEESCVEALQKIDFNVRPGGYIDFNKNGVKDVYEDPTQPVERRVGDLLSQMTVEEKTCQLATLYGSGRVLRDVAPTEAWTNEVWKDGIANIDEELNGVGTCYRTNADLVYPFSNHVAAVNAIQRWFVEKTRLGIPVDFSNEGIHGLNHTKATPLPAPIGIGSTWNRALVREAGEIVGEEARLIGYSSVYAPILDVARDPRWGRTLECYGEDPFLVGALGAEMVRGIQSKGIASTLKHFAAYSVPKGGRDGACRTDPHITPRELHEIFLRPFRHVIRETHPLGVMCSYNDWNGEPVAASRYFLTDLLRGEYGFDGFVVSDSEAVEFLHTKHEVAETYADACRMALEAGMNVRTHFTPPEDFIRPVREQIASGQLPMSVVDQRVAEVLSVKFRLGLFDRPYLGDAENADRLAGMERHLEFVDRMQAEAMVLLKNDGLLPLAADRVKRVLVTGPLADETNFMSSRYGPNGHDCISVLRGLRDYLKGRAEVVYEKGCEVVDANWPDSEIVPTSPTSAEETAMRKATDAASDCDVIVAVLGEDEFRTGESRSRTSLDLPGRQQMLLERLQATGKPVVLVLVNGQPLTINWADRHVAAILEAWFPHCRGGIAVAKTLFGEVNPSGRLTVTFPKSVGQIEYNFPFKKGSHGDQNVSCDPNGSGKTRVMGALYPFGHGLSYTSFAYANEEVEVEGRGRDVRVRVSCDVTNTGLRDGSEVVQLYVRDVCSSVVTYDSVLRGFEKVFLKAGERRRVTFTLTAQDFQILAHDMEWIVEPGEFEIRVGASCEDIRLEKTIFLGSE